MSYVNWLPVLLSGLTIVLPEHSRAAPIISGTYYEERVAGSGCSVNDCTATFSGVPAGRTMTTSQIDCLAAGSALHPLYAYFKVKYINRLVYAELTRTGDDGDYNYYHFSYDGPIRLSGETLTASILARSNTTVELSCTLLGEVK